MAGRLSPLFPLRPGVDEAAVKGHRVLLRDALGVLALGQAAGYIIIP
jgi:hypothetical protein